MIDNKDKPNKRRLNVINKRERIAKILADKIADLKELTIKDWIFIGIYTIAGISIVFGIFNPL